MLKQKIIIKNSDKIDKIATRDIMRK